MKKVFSLIFTFSLVFIGVNFVYATTQIEKSCTTKCANDNLKRCDDICEQVSFCYEACMQGMYNPDAEYCENQCYINHYHEPYDTSSNTSKKYNYEEFNYNDCKLSCSTAGSEVVYCKAGCDARNFVKGELSKCLTDSCRNTWYSETVYQLKYKYYIDYYKGTSSDGGFNYSTFDYGKCTLGCKSAGSETNNCMAGCEAREITQYCILNATSQNIVDTCKNNFQDLYESKREEYNGTFDSTDEPSLSQQCSNQCSAECEFEDNRLECYRYCYDDCIKEGNVKGETPAWNEKFQCGDFKIPYLFVSIVNTVITIIKIAVPVIIIILGSLDLLKAVMAQKEDEIKKGQQTFIKRLIVGAVVFLVFAIVQMIIGLVAPKNDSANTNMWNCVDCFVNGNCK